MQKEEFLKQRKVENFKLENMGLVAGMLDQIQLAQITDNILSAIPENVKSDFTYGQLLKLMVLHFLGTRRQNFSQIFYQTDVYPINAMLDVDPAFELDLEEGDEEVMFGGLLDAIAQYGTDKFSTELFNQALLSVDAATAVECVHFASLAREYQIVMYPRNQEQRLLRQVPFRDQKQAKTTDQSSQDTKESLSIMHVASASSAALPSLPLLCLTSSDGDPQLDAQVLEQSIPRLKTLYKALKYVILDTASANFKNVFSLQQKGLCVILRMPVNSTKSVLAQAQDGQLEFETVTFNGKESKAAWVAEPHVFEGWLDQDNQVLDKVAKKQLPQGATQVQVPFKLLVVQTEGEATKLQPKTVERRAIKEQTMLTSELNWMLKHPFGSQSEAEEAVNKLNTNAQYCKLTNISYQEKPLPKPRGRKADAAAASAKSEKAMGVVAKFDVELDQDKMELAINPRGPVQFYVLAVSDNAQDLSAQKLFELYNQDRNIDSTWRDIRAHQLDVDSYLVATPERAQALLVVATVAMFAIKLLLQKVHDFMAKVQFSIAQGAKRTMHPSWSAIDWFFNLSNRGLSINTDTEQAVVHITHPLYKMLLDFLGKDLSKYYNGDFYHKYAAKMIQMRKEEAEFWMELFNSKR